MVLRSGMKHIATLERICKGQNEIEVVLYVIGIIRMQHEICPLACSAMGQCRWTCAVGSPMYWPCWTMMRCDLEREVE